MARQFKQVKTSPHLFEFAAPPRSLFVRIIQGPKTSNPTFVKGGGVSNRSGGKSAICCVNSFPLSFLQTTHWLMILETILFAPTIHNPAFLNAP